MNFSLRLLHFFALVILLLTPQLLMAQCLEFSTSTIPFSKIYYISDEDGYSMVVGKTNANFFQSVPLPTVPDHQLFCNWLQLAPGVFASAFVPTANERLGDFSSLLTTGGIIIGPLTGNAPLMRIRPPRAMCHRHRIQLPSSCRNPG